MPKICAKMNHCPFQNIKESSGLARKELSSCHSIPTSRKLNRRKKINSSSWNCKGEEDTGQTAGSKIGRQENTESELIEQRAKSVNHCSNQSLVGKPEL